MPEYEYLYVLPSLGADMDEASLLEWKIKPGDQVKRGQVVAVLETVKAAIDAEIWVDGRVKELLVQPDKDRKLKVGIPLAKFLTETPVETLATSAQQPDLAAGNQPVDLKKNSLPAQRTPGVQRKILISPAARRRMVELGIAESDLPEKGAPLGIADIEAYASQRSSNAPKTMREAIAQAMSKSKREIPHYYLATEIDMTNSLVWLRAENKKRSLDDRLLPAVLLIRAVALAVKRFPAFNGFYVRNTFQPSEKINVAMAFALREGGLIAPSIHDTDTIPVDDLMKKLGDLGERTRNGGLKAAEMSEQTITITSLGDLGVEEIFPIIMPPQVAMVGFGMLSRKPWVVTEYPNDDGTFKIEAREIIHASLAADHRVTDGREGALFLSEIKDLLEQVNELVEK